MKLYLTQLPKKVSWYLKPFIRIDYKVRGLEIGFTVPFKVLGERLWFTIPYWLLRRQISDYKKRPKPFLGWVMYVEENEAIQTRWWRHLKKYKTLKENA